MAKLKGEERGSSEDNAIAFSIQRSLDEISGLWDIENASWLKK
jgi:hypothetical protein